MNHDPLNVTFCEEVKFSLFRHIRQHLREMQKLKNDITDFSGTKIKDHFEVERNVSRI